MFFSYRVLYILILSLIVVQLKAQIKEKLVVSYEQTDSTLVVYAQSDVLFPQTVVIEFEYKGLALRNKIQDSYIVDPETTRQDLITFYLPDRRSWSFNYQYTFYAGNRYTQHDDAYVYRIPVSTLESYPLTQGYNGRATHQGKNALDFTMPEGTEIFAAREGLVVGTKEDSNQACPDPSCASLGNYVRIMHSDGTFADYYHLQMNGALVSIGQSIKKGQLIALSGNTGWTTGAHLHFVVYKYDLNQQITYKTLFQIEKDKTGYLKEGNSYKGITP